MGPEHIDTAGGYYYMASVFLLQDQVEAALASFDKVVDIWYKFLLNLMAHPQERITHYLGEAQIGEASEMLKKILDSRIRFLGHHHIATAEAAYTVGILMLASGQRGEAKTCFLQAVRIYDTELGSEHESTMDIKRALQGLQGVQAVPLPGLPLSVDGIEEEPAADGNQFSISLSPP
eukprot:TRINITY_DN4854_c0_g1_i5.p1 TRINITY_DN4854_c0_g1~~TRINITY_DN4854_c0_g1_i5.p1  ORF type:complete len:197 (-),score=56.19 TRINITY_DN4854_c0_g1_i5:151-681(-)